MRSQNSTAVHPWTIPQFVAFLNREADQTPLTAAGLRAIAIPDTDEVPADALARLQAGQQVLMVWPPPAEQPDSFWQQQALAEMQKHAAALFARAAITAIQALPHLRLDVATAAAFYDVPLVGAARTAWEASGERSDAVHLLVAPGAVSVKKPRQRVPPGVLVVSAEAAVTVLVARGFWTSGEASDGGLFAVAEARRILGAMAVGLSDADVRRLRDQAEALARHAVARCRETATSATTEAEAERAAILQFDGGMPRERAERLARGQRRRS